MKKVIEYINESLQIINESFECDVLKRADASIKKLQKEQNDYYKQMYGDTTYVRKLQSIKDVFSWIPGVELSKVTNDMVSEASPSDKETMKRIRKIIKGDLDEVCLGFINDNIRCITSSRDIIYTWPVKVGVINSNVSYGSPQYMKLAPFEDCDTVYFIEVTEEMRNEYYNKRKNRSDNKQGMIYQRDASFYEKLAKENRDRYRRIIQQNRAKQLEHDELIAQYKDIVEKTVKLSADVATNPEKYNSNFYQFTTLMENMYGKKVYNYKAHSVMGQDGVFVLFTEYVDLKRDVMKDGGYEYQSRDLKTVGDKLKEKLNNVQAYIEKNFGL